LRPEYEPTGLRHKLCAKWALMRLATGPKQRVSAFFSFASTLLVTALALILWQPVTAACKFYRDARYEASEGLTKVSYHNQKLKVNNILISVICTL
jgi:hypothetical protein